MELKYEWKANPEYKLLATIDDAKFIYDQAEKKLKEIISSGDLVVNRTTTLITVVVGVIVGLLGYSINRYYSLNKFDASIWSCIIGIIYLFFILYYLRINFKGAKYSIIGASPKTLFSSDFFKVTDEKLRSKMFIWAQIENYQDSIDKNSFVNNQRWDRFNLSVTLIMFIPVLLTVIFFILQCFLSEEVGHSCA